MTTLTTMVTAMETEFSRQLAEVEAGGHVSMEAVARAGLVAIREAADVGHAGSVAFFDGPLDDDPSKAASQAFTAMIDAILNETP
jgi:hypothetical protein